MSSPSPERGPQLTLPGSGKSTNVRALGAGAPLRSAGSARVGVVERTLRLAFRHIGPFAPGPAAVVAETLFFIAPRGRSPRIEAFLRTGRAFQVGSGAHRLAAWRWGRGPRVVLLHGWAGQAGQLASFVEPLVAAGYEVIALDAPGHGRSSGLRSSMVDFAAALRRLERECGTVHAVVAHSLGGAATALALSQGLKVARVVLIGTPAGPSEWTRLFAERLTVPGRVMDRMRARAERRLGYAFADLDVPTLASRLTTPALILHDRDDREVSWQQGAAVAGAWRDSLFVSTSGLGHRRVLRDPTVIEETVRFLGAGKAEGAAGEDSGNCAHGFRACDACVLEEDLYVRSRRWPAAAVAL